MQCTETHSIYMLNNFIELRQIFRANSEKNWKYPKLRVGTLKQLGAQIFIFIKIKPLNYCLYESQ